MQRLFAATAALSLAVFAVGCDSDPSARGTGTSTSGTAGMDGEMERSDAEGTIDSGSSGAVRGPGD